MFRVCTRVPRDHLLLLQALMTGVRKRGSGTNDPVNNERAKLRRAAVAVSEILPDLNKVAACFECCTKTLRRWISRSAAGEPMGNAAVPGRPLKLDADQQAALRGFGSTRESGSAAKAAAALWQEHDIEISKSTAWRILTSDGFAFRVFRRVPLLLPIHKAARVKFSQHYSDKGFSYWSQLMFTDSKYFTISSSSGRIGHYELTVTPPSTVPTPKRGAASLHVYMGCTVFGLTEMVLVSGGSLKNSKFFRKDGSLYSGVSAAEYQHVVLPAFKADGKVLFGRRSWILQQDGARIHTSASSMVEARALAPGGLLEPWPANSPDFSPIENVWAMMAEKLGRMQPCTTSEELWGALQAARAEITPANLQNLFESMPRRLADCIERGGATVRF